METNKDSITTKRTVALKQRDHATLTVFLKDIRGTALKYTQLRVINEDAALDILQDAMLGFAQSAGQYEPAAWKNLFFKILNRRIIDVGRKQRWRNRLAQTLNFSQMVMDKEEQPPEPEFVDADATDSNVHVQRLIEQFESALVNLPDRQQEAYLLRQWQDLSVAETAQIMNCSQGSVKTHLARAMKALRKQLGEWIKDEA